MRLGPAVAVAVLLWASPLFAAPCAAADAAQQRGTLPRGGAYVLDSNPTIGAAAIGLWFRAPGAGYDNATPGIARLAATAAAVAPLTGGKSLVDIVRSVGGELNINVYPDIVGVGAVIPSSGARRVVAAMTAAYFAPTIGDAAVKTAQRDAAVLAVQQRYSTDFTLHDLLFKQIFSAGPAHYPALPDSVSDIARISPENIASFAKRAFRSGNALLAMTGNVDASTIGAVTDGTGGAMDPPFDSSLSGATGETTASGEVPGTGLAWVGPPIADEKAATALDFVADYLFRDQTGVVTRAIDAGNTDAYVIGQFITLHDPGVMRVTIGGSDDKTAAKTVLGALAKMASPMDPKTFSAAREAFLYHIASDTQTPDELSDNLGWYASEGRPEYAPGDDSGAYLRDARALDPEYVSEIVRKYLTAPVTVRLITVAPKGPPS
jgi:predicted Zn-dependent peptidase